LVRDRLDDIWLATKSGISERNTRLGIYGSISGSGMSGVSSSEGVVCRVVFVKVSGDLDSRLRFFFLASRSSERNFINICGALRFFFLGMAVNVGSERSGFDFNRFFLFRGSRARSANGISRGDGLGSGFSNSFGSGTGNSLFSDFRIGRKRFSVINFRSDFSSRR